MTPPRFARVLLLTVLAVASGSCLDRHDALAPRVSEVESADHATRIHFVIGEPSPSVRGSGAVTVGLSFSTSGPRPAALAGSLTWDPETVEFLGQIPTGETLVMADSTARS